MRPSVWHMLPLLLASLAITTLAHSLNDRRLQRIEGLSNIQLDIAPRPENFYKKRSMTPNAGHHPKLPRSIAHDDILRLSLTAYNTTFHLHLHPNDDLFHPNAVVNYGGVDSPLRREDYRVYRGHVIDPHYTDLRWREDQAGVWRDELTVDQEPGVLGWARVTVRHDLKHDLAYPIFEGSFRVHHDLYHVKHRLNYRLAKRSDDVEPNADDENSHMVIYRDSDTIQVAHDSHPQKRGLSHHATSQCGFDRLLHPPPPHVNRYASHAWDPFSTGSIEPFNHLNPFSKRAPSGCPTTKKINYMGAASDCTYTKYYQGANNARTQIIQDWNSASAVYERSFNIQLGLINITIMPEDCPSSPSTPTRWNQACSTSYAIDSRLSDFSQWRGSLGDDGAGLWHLMTSCASGIEVGVAWSKTLCQTGASQTQSNGRTEYASGTGVSSIIRDEWKVVAHEIGHNFGAIHDCTSDSCPCSGSSCQCCPLSSSQCDAGGQYIMNPSSNVSSEDFSPCSIKTICDDFPSLGTCLEEPGSRTIKTLQMCGNGIKEDGEDCDPGGKNTTCCDASTCKFINNAKCDDASDLCCSNCQLRPASYVCRAAASECDVEEKCSGTSGDCPTDQYKTDGTDCSNGNQCASGQCTSRDQQCTQRGSSMSVSRACGSASGSCQLICDNPGGMGCIIFNGNFLDGTPCGVGGACKSGKCSLDNFGDNAKNWIDHHKEIAIPVIVVVGLLVLLCLLRCVCYGCCGMGGYRNVNKGGVYVVSGAPAHTPPPYYGPPPGQMPPPPQGWVNPAAYNGYHPPAPPPTYTPGPGQPREQYEMNNWQASPSPSPAPADVGGGGANVSGRVRRFEERMV